MRYSILKRGRKRAAACLLLVLLFAQCCLFLRAAPMAYAAVPQTLTGTCSTAVLNPGPTNDHYNLFAVTMPDGQVVVGHCIDYGRAAPADGRYSFTGTWNGSSYDILVHSETATPQSMAPTPCQRVSNFSWAPSGELQLRKASANDSLSSGNDCYSLQGASYGVYEDSACSKRIATLETDSAGKASKSLPVGSYWVKELQAPKGFALDSKVHAVDVSYDHAVLVGGGSVEDTPKNCSIGLLLEKDDAELQIATAQGSASLEGAEFTVSYYDGYYESADEALVSGSPLRTWVFGTDSQGSIVFDAEHQISGDAFYRDSTGAPCLPLGTVLVQETKAPVGYLASDEAFVRQVVSSGTAEKVSGIAALSAHEQVIRGGVRLSKLDAECRLPHPLGAASLDGATFQIYTLNEGPVLVDGVTYHKGEVVKTVSVQDGIAQTQADDLPYGSYCIQELKPGQGYLLNTEEHPFCISEPGVVELSGDKAARNQVIRGDFSFTKVLASDERTLAGIPFRLTSKTTGESHLVVTDENGQVSTAAAFTPHTLKSNANDKALNEDGSVDELRLDPEAGLWFGLAADGSMVPANDTLGALPFDSYVLEELPVQANEGCELVKREFTISRDSYMVNEGVVKNGRLGIQTAARDSADGDGLLACDDAVSITDRVFFENLNPEAEYLLKAMLVSADDSSPLCDAQGKPYGASLRFSPAAPSGYAELEIPLNALELGGKKVVVFEELYDASGRLLAEHKDAADAYQTLLLQKPEIGTSLSDEDLRGKESIPRAQTTLVDEIAFRNLVVGKRYQVEGRLMDKQTGEPVLDARGNAVTASVDFMPEAAEGAVSLAFDFDSSLLAGRSVVAFETLYRDGIELAVHADLEDGQQTVDFSNPQLMTRLAETVGGVQVSADLESLTLIDVVEYEGLVPGCEYRVTGSLMDAEAQEPLEQGEGELAEPVSAQTTFVPESAEGCVAVEFCFDASKLAGKNLVAFENLLFQDEVIASHADWECSEQTVQVVQPKLGTVAHDAADGDKLLEASQKAQVIDEVRYENLIEGESYCVRGILYDKAGERLLDASDVMMPGEVFFTPEKTDGSVEVEISFDAQKLAGCELVVFEYLYKVDTESGCEVLVATHADRDDADQTVEVSMPPKGAYAKTGVNLDGIICAIAGLILLSTAAGVAGSCLLGKGPFRSALGRRAGILRARVR